MKRSVFASFVAAFALFACADEPETEIATEPAFAAPQSACTIGTGAHSPGVTGAALAGSTSSCAAVVTATDPYCATTTWDQQCVEAAARRCGCGPQPLEEEADVAITQLDLDGDGTLESLSTGLCASGSGHCVRVDSGSPTLAGRSILVDATGKACPLQAGGGYPIKGRRFMALGDLAGADGVSELSVLYCGASNQAGVAVVNVNASQLLGRALAPAGQKKAYADFVRDPQGKLYPFLAPPLGDGDTTQPIWGFLCQYRPGSSSPGCGAGFQQIATTFGTASYRDAGGTLSDTNGDGWTDLNLIYHTTIRTFSGANGAVLATTTFDPAAPASQVVNPGESPVPLTPTNFHSGRLYGVHGAGRTVQPAQNGKQRIAIIAGNQVGDFTDPDCNVSRFVSVLQHPPGQPSTRTLKWSRYYGFSVHNLSNDCNSVLRATDKLNGCVHRFSDARVLVDGGEALAFNVSSQSTATTCLAEQQEVCRTNFSQAALDAQFNCQSQWLHQPASWNVRVVNETNGTAIASLANRYLWGYSDRLIPGTTVYLTQAVPAGASFDRPAVQTPVLDAYSLSGGVFTFRGSFPVAGRPLIRRVRANGQRGVGSATSFAELTLVDAPAGGVGVKLDDASGSVVVWNGSAFVLASSPPPTCTYAVSPTVVNASASAGGGSIAVSTAAGCAWSAQSNAPWITITGFGGNGAGSASYTIAANSGAARSGTMTIAGRLVTISQAAGSISCTYTLSPSSASFSSSGASSSVTVSTQAGCTWSATSSASWLTVTTASGSGTGAATYAVAANTGAQRSATITIAGQTHSVTQAAGTQTCTPSANSCCQACGGFAGACYCDALCSQYGDCCADKAATCGP